MFQESQAVKPLLNSGNSPGSLSRGTATELFSFSNNEHVTWAFNEFPK